MKVESTTSIRILSARKFFSFSNHVLVQAIGKHSTYFSDSSFLTKFIRLLKEVSYYEGEVKENESKLAEMKAANKDPYDIKKFEEVLGESYMMIPDSKSRLKQALEELSSFLQSSEVEEHKSNEWYVQAQELLAKEKDLLDMSEGDDQETNVEDLKSGEAF